MNVQYTVSYLVSLRQWTFFLYNAFNAINRGELNQESQISASYADALIYQRGIHDIEHGITYDGSNFVFHDSQGFESGAKEEIEVVWDFIEKQSSKDKLKDQLHAIW